MTRKEIEAEYVCKDGYIESRGKFEGEQIFAPYFYDATMDGVAEELVFLEDGCGQYVALVEIDDDDRTEFPEIGREEAYAMIVESEQGFVSVCTLTEKEADQVRVEYETEDDGDDSES